MEKLVERSIKRFDANAMSESASVRAIIPSQLYFSWITEEGMPLKMASNYAKWQAMNPSFVFRFFNDSEQRQYMAEECLPHFAAWDAIEEPFAAKADIFRYCLLLNEGGIWSDIDVVPVVSLAKIIDASADLLVVDDGGMGDGFLYNAFFAVIAGHPVLERALKIIEEHFEQRLSKGAVWVTGPEVFWRALNDTKNKGRVRHLQFDGNFIRNEAKEIVLKAKYDGYLKDAKTNGGKPHYGRHVKWKN